MKKIILISIVLATVFSCKSDKKVDENQLEVKEVQEKKVEINQMKIVIDAIVLEDDVFEVYFYELGDEKFNSHDFIETKVKGFKESQEIVLVLPEGVYPERLRLDFGKNKQQKEILLKGVKFVFGEKEYKFEKEEIVDGFVPSKYISFDKQTMLINTKVVEGKYDPYFYTRRVTNIVDYLLED